MKLVLIAPIFLFCLFNYMKPSKQQKLELKRMGASFKQGANSRKLKLDSCLMCKQDPGKNFVFVYKRNNELKGKICISCYHNKASYL